MKPVHGNRVKPVHIAAGVTVAIALAWRSVWAIVIGSLLSSVVSTVWSHRLIAGYRNRFQYDREMARSMLRCSPVRRSS